MEEQNVSKEIRRLIQAYSKLPGVGRKTAERYAFTTLNWDEEWINEFITSLSSIKDGIKRCEVCGNLSEGDKCEFCMNDTRNHNVICVVQSPKDIAAIESMQEYNGVYHVLNGLINIQKGILPENLNIQSLVNRINDDIRGSELLRHGSYIEGETTDFSIFTKVIRWKN